MRVSSPNSYIPWVWDQNNDTFDSTQLAANWDAIDAQLGQPRTTNSITQIGALPTSLNNTTDRGKIYYLTAPDQGFSTGTIVRWNGSAWNDVKGVELQSTLPTLNNYDGRLILLSASASGFAAWTLVRYLTGSWYQVNQGIEIVSAVPVSNNFAGRVVILSSASGIFKAYDVIRYDGSAYKLVGPQPVPPGTELVYFAQTTDITTVNQVAPGDTLLDFGTATYENVKHYLHIMIPRLNFTAAGNVLFQLREAGSNVGNPMSRYTAGGPLYDDYSVLLPFTPSAASHDFSLTWYISDPGTATINSTGLAPAIFRIIKA
jgi:hypothetical protein